MGKSLDFVDISDSDLDNDSWEAAEKQYLQGNNKQAITNLSSYIKTFPNGIRILKANFYLAESYFKEESANSIPYYEYTISKSRNEYTEQALSRLCQIFLRNTNYVKAIPVLLRLETEADFPQNKTYAQANLMKSYYTEKDYANSVIYAEKVLENPKNRR